MTTKELLYLEDALGHEKYFQTKCSETANQIQDADLKSCVQQMTQKHQQIFSELLRLALIRLLYLIKGKRNCESAFYPLNFWIVPKPHKFAVCARKECL